MKILIFPAVAAFWALLGAPGCSDGGKMGAEYSCAPATSGYEIVQSQEERNAAMIDNTSQVADGASAQSEAAAVRKLETATFALG